MIGNIVGRAIFDSRTIDLPMNSIWWKLVKGEDCSLNDLQFIDSSLFTQIHKLQAIQDNFQRTKDFSEANLKFDGMELEDLCIFFVIPGTNIELIPRGSNVILNISNLGSYLESFKRTFFVESMKPQLKGFIQGFTKVISASSLDSFFPFEIERLYYGESQGVDWEEKELMDNIIPAYGYTKESRTYLNFIKYLQNLKSLERREFLRFITGSPRLPLGGLASLTPKITVVKKLPNGKERVDDILPSVMTCQNYVKLPDYSNYVAMEKKIRYAVDEGQRSFSLS